MSRSRFFEKNSTINQQVINSDIIRKLTAARLSDYNILKISTEFSEHDYPEIKVLINELGSKILKTRFAGENQEDDFTKAREQFLRMTDNFIAGSKNKFAVIIYSAQLLQYYTVICQKDLNEKPSCQGFAEFLENYADIFGNANNNPFIVEYKLIKVFNELCMISDSHIEFEKQLTSLMSFLTPLQAIVDELILSAPDYVFSQYLVFVINCIRAKVVEINFLMLRNTPGEFSIEEQELHSDAQQIFIREMQSALQTIADLFDTSAERGCVHVKGMEYCFGQDLFVKFPRQNMETMQRNTGMLL